MKRCESRVSQRGNNLNNSGMLDMHYSSGNGGAASKAKRMNASVIEIDEIVDEKIPTFTEEEVDELFLSKCKDLTILPFPLQQVRF